MMKHSIKKGLIAITAAAALISSTALAKDNTVQAEDNTALEKVIKELTQRGEDSQSILDAIQSGASSEDIQKMLDHLKPVDFQALGLPQEEYGPGASMTGAMYSGGSSSPGIDQSRSLQMQLAQLQMQMADSVKNQASDKLKEIQRLQDEVTKAGRFMNQATQLQDKAETTRKSMAMPPDMKYYMDSNKLSYPRPMAGGLYSAQEWTTIISRLQSYSDKLGTDIMRLMAGVQDFMGQYNSNVQDSSITLQKPPQTLQGISKGQSLFSQQGGAVNTAPIATSMILGVLVGMVLMWGILKKKGKGTFPGACP